MKQKRNLQRKIAPILLSLVILLLLSCVAIPIARYAASKGENTEESFPDGELTVHFLDVGQGFCALLLSDGHAMLLDGGGRESSSFVVAYLKEHEIDHLDYLVASHFDEDHIAGLIGVLRTAKVDAVIQPAYEADTKICRSLLRAEEEAGVPVLVPGAELSLGTPIPLGSAFFTFLGPASYAHDVENDNSLVLRASCGKRHFLFPGDAEAAAEGELLSGGLPLRADVLAVGHHGSATSTTEAFLTAVQPKIAVISCGKNNPYGHPAEQTLSRLKARGTEILRTDLSGTIILSTDGQTMDLVTR